MRGKKEQGITLIALIITIIVMLILVTVTVTSAINGGIFKKAGEAVSKTKDSMKNEQDAVNKLLAEMEKYQSGEGGTPPTGDPTDQTEVKAGEKAKKSLPYKEGGKVAIIPGGFTVSGIPEEQSIDGGLVIYLIPEGEEVDWTTEEGKTKAQQSYDQYVWVPVEYTPSGKTDTHGLDENFTKVFYRSSWEVNKRLDTPLDTSYNEPYTIGYPGEKEDYYYMMKSVQENGGFYIGRYEAGSQDTAGKLKARGNTANGDTKVVVRRDQYVYNYVGWGNSMNDIDTTVTYGHDNEGHGAVYLSKHLYDGNKEINGVKSMLTYGVQWDAVLDFIKSKKDVTDSTEWGNYYNNGYTIRKEASQISISGVRK